MDWDHLRIFLAVARTGTVVDAGRLCRLDHSTISRRLAALEQDLDTVLFERAGRRLRITEAGNKLRRLSEKLESTVLSEIGNIQDDRARRAGRVRIGAPEGYGVAFLAPRMGEISQAYPEIALELIALPRNFSLAEREVDIAITLDRPPSGDLTVRRLCQYRLQLYGTEAYFSRYGRPVSAKELNEHRLCGYIDELLHSSELDYLDKLGSNLNTGLRCTSIVAQQNIVLSGHYIGVLPDFMACADEQNKLIPILRDKALIRTYWLAVHRDLRQVERVQLVGAALVDMARKGRPLFMGTV